jgi:hypothetical protein
MQLPEPGDVLTYEVSPGRCVLLRVVARVDDARCVVLTRWQGKAPKKVPTAKSVKEVQPLEHHQWKRPMVGGWVREPLPDEVVRLGKLAVTRTERARVMHPRDWVNATTKTPHLGQKVLPMSGWAGLLRDAKAQWRWDHDRDAVLAEEAAVQAAKLEAFNRAVLEERERKTALLARDVKSFREERFFATWEHAPKALVTALEGAMQAAVQALEGKRGDVAVPSLMRLVEAFNSLDGAHGHEFDTADAEELMEAAFTLALVTRVSEETFEARVATLQEF